VSRSLRAEGVLLECIASKARGASWIIELPGAHQLGAAIESAAGSDAASLARRLLLGSGRGRVYVDWPYADVAVATSLATAAGRWWADRRGQLQECDIHPGEWRQLQDELRLNTLHHRALDTGRVALVVYVRPLAGYSIGRDGSLQQRWADTPLPVPAQLVLPEWHLEALPPRSGGLSGLARLPRRGSGRTLVLQPALERTRPPPYSTAFRGPHCTRPASYSRGAPSTLHHTVFHARRLAPSPRRPPASSTCAPAAARAAPTASRTWRA